MQIRALAAAMVLAALQAMVIAPAVRAIPGDVDGDGSVTENDAQFVAMVAGGMFQSSSQMVTNGDVASATGNTPDGHLTLVDAVRILRAVNGLDNLGTSTGGAVAAPLMDTVAISGNLSRNYMVPPAFKVSGTAKDTSGKSITDSASGFPMVTGTVNFTNSANAILSDSAQAADGTGAYSVALGAGAYTVTIDTSVFDFDLSTGKFSIYSVAQTPTPSSLTVSADTTKDFVRPNLPAPGTVAGNITGTSATVQNLSFNLTNGGSSSGQPSAGKYSMAAAPGTGALSYSGKYVADPNVTFGMYLYGSTLTVASSATTTRDIAVPALGAIHGTVTVPTGTALASAYGGNYLNAGLGTDQTYSSYAVQSATPTAYRLALPAGTYPVSFNLSYSLAPKGTTTISYVTQATFTSADVVQNFTLPALPSFVTFSGVVQDPAGKALAGATVSMSAQRSGTLTSGYYATAYGTTDATGAFSFTVLPGTYTVYIQPPQG